MARYLQIIFIIVLTRAMSAVMGIPFVEANAIAYGLAIGLMLANGNWGSHNPTGLPFFNKVKKDDNTQEQQ